MALSDHLANRQGPERQFRPPCAMAQKRTIVVAKALPLLFPERSRACCQQARTILVERPFHQLSQSAINTSGRS